LHREVGIRQMRSHVWQRRTDLFITTVRFSTAGRVTRHAGASACQAVGEVLDGCLMIAIIDSVGDLRQSG